VPGFIIAFLLAAATARADTYPRQPAIDVERYRFHLSLSDETDAIEGETRIDIVRSREGAASFEIDLVEKSDARGGKGMRVSAVELDGTPTAFEHARDRLAIALPAAPALARTIVLVRYGGIPAAGLRIGPNRYGERTFFSDNWPDKARHWLPVIDHPYDKAACEFAVDAPAHYQVVASGVLAEETDRPDRRRLTRWRQDEPIAPWLYGIGVARFAVQHLGVFRGVPLQTWVYARDRDNGFGTFAHPTPEAFTFFSDKVGPFAYGKLANVQAAGVRGGMELASNIFYGEDSVAEAAATPRWRNVIVHEIAHQWFGDSVTESDWDDVWLSEGFATYFTLLFIEHAHGRDAFLAALAESRTKVLEFEKENPGYRVIHDNLADTSKVLSSHTYQKGAWTLHMLRGEVGDDAFWGGIREYYRLYAGRNASTADLQRVMENASGRKLGWLFDQWLRRGGIPAVQASWRYDAVAKKVRIDLAQSSGGPAMRLPLQIVIDGRGTERRKVSALFDKDKQTLVFEAPTAPTGVALDPDSWLLMTAEVSGR
jgi:aminopeptidase N